MATIKQKLPKAFKTKWIKALRSGEFKQGKYQLHDKISDTYCCLGVACRIDHPKMKLNASLIQSSEIKRLDKIKIPNLLKGNNVKSSTDYNPIVHKLSYMNDNGKSFNYIASYIERYL